MTSKTEFTECLNVEVLQTQHAVTHTHLYDSIHRTRLLTEAAVDAFGHVDVIASRPPAAVSASLCFNADGLNTNKTVRMYDNLTLHCSAICYWN